MNPEEELQRICEANNGTFYIGDSKFSGELGAQVFISKYKVVISHNNATMEIVYNYGNSDTAVFKIQIKNIKEIPDFRLKSIDHFTKLVLFKKSNWKVQSKDMLFKREIEKLVQKHTLDALLKNSAFEPNIQGSYSQDIYTIHTFFSLIFEGNIESMESLIEFHKGLVDLIKERYS